MNPVISSDLYIVLLRIDIQLTNIPTLFLAFGVGDPQIFRAKSKDFGEECLDKRSALDVYDRSDSVYYKMRMKRPRVGFQGHLLCSNSLFPFIFLTYSISASLFCIS
jgi:hypothetical protein